MIVYRYDDSDYSDGQIIYSRVDHITALDSSRLAAERALRAHSVPSEVIRRESLYTWEDREWAVKASELSRKKYLYELEIEVSDIAHRGDANCFSVVQDSIANGTSPDAAVSRYWNGEGEAPKYPKPRVEILVKKAKVIGKVK